MDVRSGVLVICRTDHAALKQPPQWSELPLVGVQHTPADDTGPAEDLELKNCPACGSTLAVVKVAVQADQRFGRWTVLARAARDSARSTRAAYWDCVCDCGTRRSVRGTLLVHGRSASCGCVSAEMAVARSTTHGHAATKAPSLTYRSWRSMMSRCSNPKDSNFENYGARGIVVCERWTTFEAFLVDMGERPSIDLSIDRFPDTNGNYEPGNCRWATRSEQQRNRRPSSEWKRREQPDMAVLA